MRLQIFQPDLANNVVTCTDSSYGLQINFGKKWDILPISLIESQNWHISTDSIRNAPQWSDASNVTCDNFRFKAKLNENSGFDARILNGLRCIRKKIENFSPSRDSTHCLQDEKCTEVIQSEKSSKKSSASSPCFLIGQSDFYDECSYFELFSYLKSPFQPENCASITCEVMTKLMLRSGEINI